MNDKLLGVFYEERIRVSVLPPTSDGNHVLIRVRSALQVMVPRRVHDSVRERRQCPWVRRDPGIKFLLRHFPHGRPLLEQNVEQPFYHTMLLARNVAAAIRRNDIGHQQMKDLVERQSLGGVGLLGRGEVGERGVAGVAIVLDLRLGVGAFLVQLEIDVPVLQSQPVDPVAGRVLEKIVGVKHGNQCSPW